MKQCIKCTSEDLVSMVEKDRIFYYCNTCKNKSPRIINNEGKIVTKRYKYNKIKHVVVSALIRSTKNEILFIKRNKFPFGYAFPSSHVFYGETIEKALERSIFQETGIEIGNKKLIFNETIPDKCKDGANYHEWYLFEFSISNRIVLEQKEENLVWIKESDINKLTLAKPMDTLLKKLGLIKKAKKDQLDKERDEDFHIKNLNESIIENLPVAVLIFDKDSKKFVSNKIGTNLLRVISEVDKDNYKNFIKDIKKITQRTIKSKIGFSSSTKVGEEIYNIISSPLFNKKELSGTTITIKNISDKSKHEIYDVLQYETSMAMSSNLSAASIIRNILKQLFLKFDISGTSLMIEEDKNLIVRYNFSKTEKEKHIPRVLKINEGVAGWVYKNKTPLAIVDTGSDPLFIGCSKNEDKSLLSVPIISSGTTFGVLNLSRPKDIFFSEEEMKIAVSIANKLGMIIERDQLFRSLNKEKNLLKKVLGSSTDGFIMTNKNFDLIFANNAAISMLPLSQIDIQRKTLTNYLSRKSGHNEKKMAHFINNSIEKRRILKTEFISQKGIERTLEAVFSPVIEKNNTCTNVLIGFNNITKVKQKQKTIKNQMKQITALFRLSSISTKTDIEFFNNIIDKTKDILESEKTGLFFTKKNLSREEEKINEKCDNETKKILLAIKHNLSNGCFLSNNAKEKFNASNVRNIIAMPLKDINEQVAILYAINKTTNFNEYDQKWLNTIGIRLTLRIESISLIKKIKQDSEQIQKIIENTGDGIIVYDIKKQNGLMWNRAAKKITGFEKMSDFLQENPIIVKSFLTDEHLKNKSKTHYEEICTKNSDNHNLWLGITFSYIYNNDTNEKAVIITIRDISRDKEIEDQQKEFIYTATHELRTPLTAIKGYLSMITNGDAGKITPLQRKFFDRAYSSTERLVSLVEDLLQVARLEENRIQFKKTRFYCSKLLDDVLSDFEQKAKDKKIEIKLVKKQNDQKILADYERTKQAIANIVDNAIKYTSHGNVTITFERENSGYAKINISDTGVGIPKKELGLVFDKFHRVANSESVRAGGTGLGLYIVKNLIEKQGGTITLESKINKGTIFHVNLPLA